MNDEYRIYLVPNGSVRDFFGHNHMNIKFAGHDCKLWGIYESIEGAKERLRELAVENFCRDDGPWDCVWSDNMDFDNVTDNEEEKRMRKEADRVANEALNKYVKDRIECMSIEWHDDRKFVYVARCDEDGNIKEVM